MSPNIIYDESPKQLLPYDNVNLLDNIYSNEPIEPSAWWRANWTGSLWPMQLYLEDENLLNNFELFTQYDGVPVDFIYMEGVE